MSLLNFEHIRYFVEVCEHKSISNAASHLFISQQALSYSINKLEEQLGLKLFQRTAKGVLPTQAGSQLYKTFLPIIQSYKKAELETLFQTGNHQTRTLSFSVSAGIIGGLTPELLVKFRESYPGLELNIIEMTDKQIEQYIHEDSSRFGLVACAEWLHIGKHNYVFLRSEPSWLLVHKSNPLSSQPKVSLASLKDERVLALSKNTYYQDALNKAVAPFGFSITPYFESIDMHDLVNMVDRGTGVVSCTKNICDEVSLPNTVLIPIIERTFDCFIAFIFQEFSALDLLSQEFIRFVQKSVQNNQKPDT